ncbi:MAG: M23 family metallopeptidase [Deferribacteraceae bacterium]|nr:M23 family metallopeptidase [Deferribacteraceae bacterium]
MNKYSIVFFDAAKVRDLHKLTVTKLHGILLLAFFVILVVSLLVISLSLSRMKRDISASELLFIDDRGSVQTDEPQVDLLQKAITMLQQDDLFVRNIYDTTPVIHTAFSFDTIAGEFSVAGGLYNTFNMNKQGNFQNMQSMLRLTDMLSAELDTRIAKYEELEDYLEEQYVIYQHTPTIWPSPMERMTSPFGFRRSPFTGVPSYHEGSDLSAPTGTPISATADGIVVFSGPRSGYGYLITIDHGFGFITRYAHNSRLIGRVGDKVSKGDIVALSGNTGRSAGAHSHYEVLYNGTPVNSRKFLPNEGM